MNIANLIRSVLKSRRTNQLNQTHTRFKNTDIQDLDLVSFDSNIGEYTYIGRNTTITKASIGRFCSIANNVSIGDGEHFIDRVSTSSHFYENPYLDLTADNCRIYNDVWIGTQSIIRRGIEVGNGAIVGANSFVNKDVPPFAIVAGSPAKVIRYRFSKEIIEVINASEWWNLNIKEASDEIKRLSTLITC